MMSDEAKLGLVAGVLAVVGVAAFGVLKDQNTIVKQDSAVTRMSPPAATPAAANLSNHQTSK